MSSKTFSKINSDFAIRQSIYLDSASTSFCPTDVVDAVSTYNFTKEAKDYNTVRTTVRNFINARRDNEIVFTSGATHSINLIAYGLCSKWRENDLIIVPESEHYSNLLVWHQIAQQHGLQFETVNVIKDGSLDLGHLQELLENAPGKILFSMAHISNSIGFEQPVQAIFNLVHQYDGITVLDASQSINKCKIDVQEMEIDFLAFSSHKMYGPTGIGVLYGRQKLLEKFDPLFYGGVMVRQVHWSDIELNILPWKLEAGSQNISGILGLEQAILWMNSYGIDSFVAHNNAMSQYFASRISELDFIEVFHPGPKNGLGSFNIKGIPSYDVAPLLEKSNIVIKSGFLSAQPIVEEKYVKGVLRASWACYNTENDIDHLCNALIRAYDLLGS